VSTLEDLVHILVLLDKLLIRTCVGWIHSAQGPGDTACLSGFH